MAGAECPGNRRIAHALNKCLSPVIGRVNAGSSRGQVPGSPAAGRYSRVLLIRLIRGSKSKPSNLVTPNPISDWPWESV